MLRPRPSSRNPNPRAPAAFSPFSARRQTPFADAPRSVYPSDGRRCATRRQCIPWSRPKTSGSADSSSCLCSSGCNSCALPSDCRTACVPSCRYPEPPRSTSRWRLPRLAAAGAAAPPAVAQPRCRAGRPGIARMCIAAVAAALPKFPSAWARAGQTAGDAVARNPRSKPAPSPG